MNEQELTIKVQIPEGYEATGEYRRPKPDEPFLTYNNSVRTCHVSDTLGLNYNRIILRKIADRVEEWCKKHPWVPGGAWVYRFEHGLWLVTSGKPHRHGPYFSRGVDHYAMNLEGLAELNGKAVERPPSDCFQVRRPVSHGQFSLEQDLAKKLGEAKKRIEELETAYLQNRWETIVGCPCQTCREARNAKSQIQEKP